MSYTLDELLDLESVSEDELDKWERELEDVMNKIYDLEDEIKLLESDIDDIGGERWYAETQVSIHNQNLEDIRDLISNLD